MMRQIFNKAQLSNGVYVLMDLRQLIRDQVQWLEYRLTKNVVVHKA